MAESQSNPKTPSPAKESVALPTGPAEATKAPPTPQEVAKEPDGGHQQQKTQPDGSTPELQTQYLEERKLLRTILSNFVTVMGQLPVQTDGIAHFFGGIEDLSKGTMYLENKYGVETTR